ncbi:MAG: AraC family transcriptional regulator [Desulfarculaceae bacterium]|jgi:AraC-like DNA-binding protein
MTQTVSFSPFNLEAIHRNLRTFKTQSIHTFNGIHLRLVDSFYPQRQASEIKLLEPFLEFSFHLSGRARGLLSDGCSRIGEVSMESAVSLVSYNPGVVCQVEVPGGEHFQEFNMYMPPETLGKLLEEEMEAVPAPLQRIATGKGATPFNLSCRLDPAMKMIVEQIINCPFTGAVKRVYMQGKAMELIAYRLAGLMRTGGKPGAGPGKKLTPQEVCLVREARERLLAHLDNPPSLTALARQAGMNASKLTEGFRSLYGVTAYSLLRQERIAKARKALKTGRMNITETAHHFGYSDASHFIREFTRYYGTTPGAFLRAQDQDQSPRESK